MKVSVSSSVHNRNFDDIQEEDIDFADRCSPFKDLFHISDSYAECKENMMDNDFHSEASYEFNENLSLGLDLTLASTSPLRKEDKNGKNSSTKNQISRQHLKKPSSARNSLREKQSQLNNVKKFGAKFDCAAPDKSVWSSENKFYSDEDDDGNEDSNYSVLSKNADDVTKKTKCRPFAKR